ncbi:MAG: IS607 family transposase [Okeania sp. SIO2G4]|uniref:IS607 family transposase n=1 Tax=unclassified Okeania TaxID=2634635 RepID=UPI0013BE5397|nr:MULTISPECIES: IS607 family transposase [unclassified Okeania]NEP39534.1 IS607 family transposase [Okeania sp. SIO2H7]NEP72753.1 IS607 family transposase [Okeania sp. SIO2G5]NEP93388.1 IS607 family transposase [Okeania sp. SIO2F5]NEQ91400.1 IS607 family transposase [Okeania sp. SIO2G4]
MSNLLTVSQAAELLGVSTKTIRRWETEGRIKSIRTEGGHRRFTVSNLIGNKQDNSLTVAYARVSSNDQKDDLERQKIALEAYCAKQGWSFEIISDLGGGLNYRKKGLIKLIKLICSDQVERLVLTHKDRLLRLGSDLIFTLCEIFGTEIVIINRTEDSTFEEFIAQDIIEIITVFSARLYGSRNHKNKQIIQQLKEVANQLK